ncbi:DUF3307 domain-containing protein [Chloroflexi bacterium TSY]|nr:DUF3307 domain-containing protein [Chloroflexi bacterium TSY]
MIEIFATLLLAHLLADFPLQTNAVARLKMKGGWGLAPHILIHVAVLALLLQDPIRQGTLLLVLGCTHWLIDWIKVSYTIRVA